MRLSKIRHPAIAWAEPRPGDDSEVVREFSDQCQFLVDGRCGDPLAGLRTLTSALPPVRSVAARVAIDRVILKVLLHIDPAHRRGHASLAFLNASCNVRRDEEGGGRPVAAASREDGKRALGKINSRDSPALTPHQIRTVSTALRHVRDHGCRRDFSLRRLAAAVGFSAFHLDRLLKAHTGESFVAHRTTARIERAKGLLVNSSLSIKEISAAVGFNTAGSFSRAFKRTCGVQPGHWRERRLCERHVRTSATHGVT